MKEKGPKAKVSRNRAPDKTMTAEDNDLLTVVLNLLDDSVRARIAGDVPLASRKNKEARAVLKHLIADRVIEKPNDVVPLITSPGGELKPVNVLVAGKQEQYVAIEMHFRASEPEFVEIRMQQMEAFLREKGIQPPLPPKTQFITTSPANQMLKASEAIKSFTSIASPSAQTHQDYGALEAKILKHVAHTDADTYRRLLGLPDAAKG